MTTIEKTKAWRLDGSWRFIAVTNGVVFKGRSEKTVDCRIILKLDNKGQKGHKRTINYKNAVLMQFICSRAGE